MPSSVELAGSRRTWSAALVLATAGVASALVALPWLTDPGSLSMQDFVEYWAAGRLNALGANPYDPAALFCQEQTASPELTNAIMMWNPPWTLSIAMPFGVLPARAGLVLWLCLQAAFILVCADVLWRYYGGPARHRWFAWLISMAFVPSLMVLRLGQISPLVLLGVVGFLICERNGRLGWAGACAVLAAAKPHLVFLFGVALLLWAWDRRHWRVILGGVIALAGLTTLPLVCNLRVLEQYHDALGRRPPEMLSPTLGALLRLAFGLDKLWLQYVPLLLGLAWLVIHWARHRQRWEWAEQTPVLLLASFLTAPYGAWQFDLVVLLIPVLQAAVWVHDRPRIGIIGFALVALVAFDGLALVLMNVHWSEQYWHVWMTPMILYCYMALWRQVKTQPVEDLALGAT
jgi:hypothetical protein